MYNKHTLWPNCEELIHRARTMTVLAAFQIWATPVRSPENTWRNDIQINGETDK